MIEERLQMVIRNVLNLPELVLEVSTPAFKVPGWDSLRHVEILLAIQDEYGVHFRPTEVIRLKNVGDLQDLVFKKISKIAIS